MSHSDIVQHTSGQFRLCLTLGQLTASRSLLDQLEALAGKPGPLVDAVNALLQELYLPSNTLNMFEDQYVNPVNTYVCLRTVHPEGGFIKPELATCHIVKTQFGIRLFILDMINRKLASYKEELALISRPLPRPGFKTATVASRPPKAKLHGKRHLVVESESDERSQAGSSKKAKMSVLHQETNNSCSEDFTKYLIFFTVLAHNTN